MKKLSKVQVLGIVRHVLTFTGGILVAKGLINDSTMVELVGGKPPFHNTVPIHG
jgi:hypothetical protein